MRIGQLADRFGVNPKTIRYYESIGLMPDPDRSPSGYRLYDNGDAERLGFIRTAQRLGLSLDDILGILAIRARDEPPCRHVVELLQVHVTELDARIQEMRVLRDNLTATISRADDLRDRDGRFCSVIEHGGTAP
ncbi:MAG: heavy metal-responsive transcriptional regulator [Euzebya sp.]